MNMNYKDIEKILKGFCMALLAVTLTAGPSLAAVHDLCATTGSVTMPDSTVVPIWGYVTGDCTSGAPAVLPGPVLREMEGQNLTVILHNNLTVPVSFFAPGLRADGAPPVGKFTAEAPANGGTASYTFSNIKAGTYLYHSGTDITTQVPMGLYGALVVDVAAGQAYPDVSYAQDKVLVYSAIDANLNADPTNFGGARVINWNPQYFLINGMAPAMAADISINTSENVLLRFVNAGLRTFVPTLDGGLYMDLKAEYGNRYPQPLQQYGIELQASKTIDAMINAGADGIFALYDRAASYDAGAIRIVAGTIAGAPVAMNDVYATDEDITLNVAIPGVLGNDKDSFGDPINLLVANASLVSNVSAGSLALNGDGSFSYMPNLDFNGIDIFTYFTNDGGSNSNVGTVTITVNQVNDGPVANDDTATTSLNTAATIDVSANDTDVDNNLDPTTANTDCITGIPICSGPTNGVLNNNGDGTFTYTPNLNYSGPDSFVYEVCDTGLLCDTATVNVTVEATPPVNIPPFANDDFASTTKNSAGITFSVTANDVDADSNIDVTSVVITTGGITQRSGTVTANPDGTVTYVPKRGFRGTDTFKYTVEDDAVPPATSNEATVRVNVQ
jgi:FtsP/CotA-like multicopper oxidase with cupredoxin domain